MESCGLESDVLIVNRAVCLHPSYQVKACIQECLLLHAMLLKPELCSPYTINQGTLLLLYRNIWDEFLCHSSYRFSLGLSRTSQFIISLNKYLEAMSNKFSVGVRFKMRFEGEDSPERRQSDFFSLFIYRLCKLFFPKLFSNTPVSSQRYSGTVVGVKDCSTHWKDSKWRCLEVYSLALLKYASYNVSQV